MDPQSFDLEHVKHIIEAALLTASEPLQVEDLQKLFDGELDKEALQSAIAEVAQGCEGRSIELVNVASGWRFRTRPEYQRFLDRMNPQKSPRYSRAVMETLAIVAYKQPVSRGDIELVRGASHTFDSAAYLGGKQTPVFFGSAVNNFGVQSLLEQASKAGAEAVLCTPKDWVKVRDLLPAGHLPVVRPELALTCLQGGEALRDAVRGALDAGDARLRR